VLAQSSAQKGVLWWAAKHRHHHLHSDMPEDLHSPRQGGLFHSHIGWIFDRRNNGPDLVKVADLAAYPELRWLQRYEALPAVALAVLCFLIAGWPGLIVGFCWSTVLVYHATFSINSFAHLRGRRRYLTGDDSRNNAVLALITMGEGWHNNHHAYQSSARQGFRWWEVDATYEILRLLACFGVVRELKQPPEAVLRNQRLPTARAVHRVAMHIAAHFKPDQAAAMIRASVRPVDLSTLTETLAQAREQAAEALSGLHLPHLPARSDFVREARRLVAAADTVDTVVARARELFWNAVAEHLAVADQARV
jgi:stearoyl-CoA desaturase (delta-9 desaturase)